MRPSTAAPRFFFDNNLSPNLVEGMKAFGEEVQHLREHFAADTEDLVWMPEVAKGGLIVVTRDVRILRTKGPELEAYRRHGLGGFWLGGKSLNRCQMIQQIVRCWPQIKELARKTAPPFVFVVPPHGTKIDRKL